MLGIGVGLANQSVTVYLSEMAPAQLRGALNIAFQMCTTLGILAANLINYSTQNIHNWGWRLSLGLAAVPAGIITLGSIWILDTPNSMIERGQVVKAKAMLEKIRGMIEIHAEFDDMMEASQLEKMVLRKEFIFRR